MSIERSQLLQYLNGLLQPDEIKDYCPNGLQVEGKSTIDHIVTGVTASMALIEQAVEQRADAILVHHGYFWRGENPVVTGMKHRRLKRLLQHDINLIAYHLPLDVHPEVGNNAMLGRVLELQNLTPLSGIKPNGIIYTGETLEPFSAQAFASHLESKLARPVLFEAVDKPIRTVAWCTGGGQGYIEQAADAGVDAFVTGEVSEQTIHTAREQNIHFFSAGHHATERYGAKSLGERIAQECDVKVTFVDIPNPA